MLPTIEQQSSPDRIVEVNPEPPIRQAVLFGAVILLVFVGTFLLWALLAPLESAAIADGKIVVDTSRKTIEHLEGGIIARLYVQEGSQVKQGDLLIELDDTQALARLDLLRGQINHFYGLAARLLAERDNKDKVRFPKRLINQKDNPSVQQIMQSQRAIFAANKATFNGQIVILQQRIKQLEKEIDSLQAQVESDSRQLELINEEIEAVAYLEARKLIERPRLLALKREAARLKGERGENLGLIAKAEQGIGETQSQIIATKDNRQKEILEDLREVRQKLTDLLEEERAAEDVLKRTAIRAPQDGTVVGLKKHTVGGVLSPSEEVMEIVPSKDELIIEARVSPLDIDVVYPGLIAKVKLTAFKQRSTPSLDGKVDTVSADILQDEYSGETYYSARIKIDGEQLKKVSHVKLYPGMPSQVMIITDHRTPMQYFLSPIKDSFNRAFREQ
jgi:HlyD family type I secretion membrane fusion protein